MRFSTARFELFVTTLALILAFQASPSMALGQEGDGGQSSGGNSAAPAVVSPKTIDDATLKRTAKAFLKVRQIVEVAKQDIGKATSDTEKQQIIKRAEYQKIAAVEAEDLQPQQYNQVIELAQTDSVFERKFMSYVDGVKNSRS